MKQIVIGVHFDLVLSGFLLKFEHSLVCAVEAAKEFRFSYSVDIKEGLTFGRGRSVTHSAELREFIFLIVMEAMTEVDIV